MTLVQSQDPAVPALQGVTEITSQGNAGVGVYGGVGLPDTGVPHAPPLSFIGVYGTSAAVANAACIGVYGASTNGTGVYGYSADGVGVQGETALSDAVNGLCHSNQHAGVAAHNDGGGSGLWAIGTPAGYFVGNVEVTQDLKVDGQINATGNINVTADVILVGANDCAEEFDVPASTDPGTVMVLGEHGALLTSRHPYDKKVAGVISGAGGFRPGLILGRTASPKKRMPLALMGQVYCKVDAQYGSVDVGDLLTTSPTPGHAMRALDPLKAFGCVIGKALRPLESGQDLIPILVTLQ
jgi:hypothetical protein